MNNIAYLTRFGVLNSHFKSFSVPSTHIYSVYSFITLKNVFSDLSSLKGDPFSIVLK